MAITLDNAGGLGSAAAMPKADSGAADFSRIMNGQIPSEGVKVSENINFPSDAKAQLCADIYAEVSAIMSGVVWPMLSLDPEDLRRYMADPGSRSVIEDSLDRVEVLLDTLLNQCADFLSPDVLARIRNMKGDLESLRGAMQFGLVDKVREALTSLAEGFSALASQAAEFTLPVIRKVVPGLSPEFN
jgi:hypothetical protein